MAWDELSGSHSDGEPTSQRAGLERSLDDTDASQKVTAAEAIAGVPAASLVAQKAQAQGKTAYAIKVLSKAHIIREKKTRYVKIEKDALWRCVRIKGVISLYWTFQDRDSLYFVLELAPNGDLRDQVRKIGSISLELTRYWAAQISQTLAAIHKAGVVHRDMKPENICLDAQYRIRITDFGSAKCTELDALGHPLSAVMKLDEPTSHTPEAPIAEGASKQSFVGTAEFVSPELLDSKKTTVASDWWAFGAIIYTLLAGSPPFRGPSEYTTFQKILHDPLTFPSTFPPVARAFVEAFLQRDPLQRLSEVHWHTLVHHPFFLTGNEPAPSSSTPATSSPAPDVFDGTDANMPEIWNDLWTRPAPPLRAGIVVRPETPEEEKNENVFAMFDTESEVVPTEDERQAVSVYSYSVASRSMVDRSQSRRASDGTNDGEYHPPRISTGGDAASLAPSRRASSLSALPVQEGNAELDDADNEDDGSSVTPSAYESSLHRQTSSGTGPWGKKPLRSSERLVPIPVQSAPISRTPLPLLTTVTSSASSPPASINDVEQSSIAALERPLPLKVREKLKSTKLRHKAKRQLSRALLAAHGEHPQPTPGTSVVDPASQPAGTTNADADSTPRLGPTKVKRSLAPSKPAPTHPSAATDLRGSIANTGHILRGRVQSSDIGQALSPSVVTSKMNAARAGPSASHRQVGSASQTSAPLAQPVGMPAAPGPDATINPSSPSRLFFRRSSYRTTSAVRSETTPPTSPADAQGETGLSPLSKSTNVPGQQATLLNPGAVAADVSGTLTAWRLRNGENMVLAAPVLQRKSGAAYLFSPKRRDLVLTDWGRLACLKPPLGQGTLKVEFVLASWAKPGGPIFPSTTSSPSSPSDQTKPDRTHQNSGLTISVPTGPVPPEPEVVVTIEPRGSKAFALTTLSKRQFFYEDPSGDNTHWIRAIRRTMASPAPSSLGDVPRASSDSIPSSREPNTASPSPQRSPSSLVQPTVIETIAFSSPLDTPALSITPKPLANTSSVAPE